MKHGEHARLHGVLLLALQRLGADQNVQRVAVDELLGALAHLIRRQVRQQIGDAEDGIALVLAERHRDGFSALFDDHAVQRQRHGQPLILLDAAVVVRVQIGEAVLLIEGILLDVDARGIDVRAEDVHALAHRPPAHDKGDKALVHPAAVHAVARLEGAPLAHARGEVIKALRPCQPLGDLHAFALGLALVDIRAVITAHRLNGLQLLRRAALPGVPSLHGKSSFPVSIWTRIVRALFLKHYNGFDRTLQEGAPYTHPRAQNAPPFGGAQGCAIVQA